MTTVPLTIVPGGSLTFVSPPRISAALFQRVLERAKSPAAAEAAALYQTCTDAGIDPAVALAFYQHESTYGTAGINVTYALHNWGSVRTPFDPAAASIVAVPGNGNFAKYATWALALKDWCQRILHRYVAMGLDTVDKAIPKYAPASDGNTPLAYIAAVEKAVAGWIAEDVPMASDGWCPWIEDRQPSPNFTEGRGGLAVKACVIHIAEGGFQGSIDWMKKVGTSSHFIIGKDGRIAQLVSINDTAYGNGLSYVGGHWIDPDGHVVNPPWPGLVPGVNPNRTTISVEHQGFTGELWTPAMTETDGRLLQWLREQTKLTWTPRQTLIGHFEISPISRANCPGQGVGWADLASRGNTSTAIDWAKEWGTVAPYQSGWGIPTAWRSTYAAGKPLGAALSVELYNDSDLVMQEFKFGWVSYRRSTGQTSVLR